MGKNAKTKRGGFIFCFSYVSLKRQVSSPYFFVLSAVAFLLFSFTMFLYQVHTHTPAGEIIINKKKKIFITKENSRNICKIFFSSLFCFRFLNRLLFLSAYYNC